MALSLCTRTVSSAIPIASAMSWFFLPLMYIENMSR